MIANRLLWVVAVLMAALMLVAGCGSVGVPDGPRVVLEEDREPRAYPQDREQVEAGEQAWLETDILPTPAEADEAPAETQP